MSASSDRFSQPSPGTHTTDAQRKMHALATPLAQPMQFHPRELFYVSNLLTVSRLLLLFPTVVLLRQPRKRRAALLCLSLAIFTDAIDGTVARRRGEISRLGEFLDPIVDKLLVDTAVVVLSQTRQFPWWITRWLLFRDVGIVLAGLLVYRRQGHITTSQTMGKVTTAGLMAAILCYIADGPRSGKPLLYATLVPFGLSFVQYGYRFVRLMRRGERTD